MSVRGDSQVSEVCERREEWSRGGVRISSSATSGAPLGRAYKLASVTVEPSPLPGEVADLVRRRCGVVGVVCAEWVEMAARRQATARIDYWINVHVPLVPGRCLKARKSDRDGRREVGLGLVRRKQTGRSQTWARRARSRRSLQTLRTRRRRRRPPRPGWRTTTFLGQLKRLFLRVPRIFQSPVGRDF